MSDGGFLVVSAGGTINGAPISGPTMEIASSGLTGGNAITYSGGAALVLDASTTFSGTIGSFAVGNYLDLRDISFNSGTTSASFVEAGSNTSGTLTVTDGTHTADLTLLGNYATGNFNRDGHGGTPVTGLPLLVATSDPLPAPPVPRLSLLQTTSTVNGQDRIRFLRCSNN